MIPMEKPYQESVHYETCFQTLATGYCKKRPYGFVASGFLLLLLITQSHYSHPGSTGFMQAAKVRKLLIDCIL